MQTTKKLVHSNTFYLIIQAIISRVPLFILHKVLLKKKDYAIVLAYHRIADLKKDARLLTVTPQKFEEQIIYLKDRFNIIGLQELVRDLENKKIKKKSLVITFDDGYEDNLFNAKPILEKYNIPATFFITADALDCNREFWWDSLERIFLDYNLQTVSPIDIKINNIRFFKSNISASTLARIYKEAHTVIKKLSTEDRDVFLSYLLNWAKISESARDNYRPLNKSELVELSLNNLFEIGSHSKSHCSLNRQTIDIQKNEISNSKNILDNILSKNIKSFSYPFGTIDHYSKNTINIVKESNYNCGVTIIQSPVYNNTDLFQIPRLLVRNWDICRLEHELNRIINSIGVISILKQKLKVVTRILKK